MPASGPDRWARPVSPHVVFLAPPAIVVGILCGDRLGPGPAGGPLLLAALAVVAAVLPGRRRHPTARVAAGLVALMALAGACEQRALDGLARSPLRGAIADRADVQLRGSLVGDPDGSRWSTRVLLHVEAVRRVDLGTDDPVGRWAPVGRTVLVEGGDRAATRLVVLASGDRVTLVGWLRPLDGFDLRWRWRHVVARFDARDLLAAAPASSVLARVANPIRDAVLRGTDLLPATERALVAGFVVGDTRDLPDEVLERFRDAGLSHLLAVSGANLAFVLALVGPLLRRLSRTPRLATTVAVLLVFGAMTRWEPSVLRAGAMASVAVVAAHVGRPVRGVRVLALAVSGLLLVDPFLLHSVGFGLSVGATLGITLLAAPCARRLRGPRWLRESLGTTIAAQVGVLPVLVPVFGELPLVSIPANLLAVPLAAPLTMWSLAAGACAGILAGPAPGLAELLQLPTLVLAEAVLGIAAGAARLPLTVDAATIAVGSALAALVVVTAQAVRRGRPRRRRLARRGADRARQHLPPR